MAQKMIYVRDEDAELWESAAAFAARLQVSLSALVSEALRRYLAAVE